MIKYLILLPIFMVSCSSLQHKEAKEPSIRILCQTPGGQPMLDTVVSEAKESQGALRIRLVQQDKVIEAIIVGATCMTTEVK